MTCESVRLELEGYAREVLDDSVAASVREHLASCRACRDALAAIEPLVSALEALPPVEVDADALADKVLAKARRGPRPPPPSASGNAPWRFALAFVLAVGGLGFWLAVRDRPAPAPVPVPAPVPAAVPAPAPAPVPAPVPAAAPVPVPAPDPAPAPDPVPVPAPAPVPSPGDLTHAPPPPPPPPSAPAPAPAPAPSAPRFAALVANAPTDARFRPAGSSSDTAWKPLALGASLAPGDEVSAVSGTLELALGTTAPPAPDAAAVLAQDRLVLAAGARATLAPSEKSIARLDAGEVFLSCASALVVEAPTASVTVDTGDATVALPKAGGLEAAALAGRVRIAPRSGAETNLAAGEKVALDKSGRAGKPARAEVPKWLASHRALDASRVVLDGKAANLLVGERAQGVLVGRAIEKKGPSTKIVCVGRGEAAGVAGHEAGLRLRFRYRVRSSVPLGVQVTDLTSSTHFQAVIAAPRVGEWTSVDVELDRLVPEDRSAKKMAAGDRLDVITLSAHGEEPSVVFEVSELLLYRPR